jgi:hypothetical protein
MTPFSISLVFVVLRSGFAAFQSALLVRQEVSRWFVVMQAASDVICALFLVGYVSDSVRAAIGNWAFVLFPYALFWELVLALGRARALREVPVTEDAQPIMYGFSGLTALSWSIFAVLPALMAGFFIAIDRAAPGNWLFPGHVPVFIF